jgi:hypothetical protein
MSLLKEINALKTKVEAREKTIVEMGDAATALKEQIAGHEAQVKAEREAADARLAELKEAGAKALAVVTAERDAALKAGGEAQAKVEQLETEIAEARAIMANPAYAAAASPGHPAAAAPVTTSEGQAASSGTPKWDEYMRLRAESGWTKAEQFYKANEAAIREELRAAANPVR